MSQRPISHVLRSVALEDAPRALVRQRASAPVPTPVPVGVVEGAGSVLTAQAQEAAEAASRGFAEGYERGLKEGLVDAAKKVEQATQQAVDAVQSEAATARDGERKRIDAALAEHAAVMRRVLEQMQQSLTSALRNMEEQAIGLAFEAVCRVVGDAAASPAAVRSVVDRVLSELAGKPVLSVRMRPDDLATLQTGADLQAMFQGFPGISWVADETIAVGGCVVETATGTLDGRLEVQLRNLGNAWRKAASEVRGGTANAAASTEGDAS